MLDFKAQRNSQLITQGLPVKPKGNDYIYVKGSVMLYCKITSSVKLDLQGFKGEANSLISVLNIILEASLGGGWSQSQLTLEQEASFTLDVSTGPTHRDNTQRQHTETTHRDNTERQHTETTHRDNTQRQHTETTHRANTQRQHTETTHRDNTQRQTTIHSHIHTYNLFRVLTSVCMSLDCGRKPDLHTSTQGHHRPNRDSNQQTSCSEATQHWEMSTLLFVPRRGCFHPGWGQRRIHKKLVQIQCKWRIQELFIAYLNIIINFSRYNVWTLL